MPYSPNTSLGSKPLYPTTSNVWSYSGRSIEERQAELKQAEDALNTLERLFPGTLAQAREQLTAKRTISNGPIQRPQSEWELRQEAMRRERALRSLQIDPAKKPANPRVGRIVHYVDEAGACNPAIVLRPARAFAPPSNTVAPMAAWLFVLQGDMEQDEITVDGAGYLDGGVINGLSVVSAKQLSADLLLGNLVEAATLRQYFHTFHETSDNRVCQVLLQAQYDPRPEFIRFIAADMEA